MVERGEFFNIGAILYCRRKKYLDLKFHVDPAKLRALAPEVDPGILKEHLKAWKAIAVGGPDTGPIGALDAQERFGWLTARRSTIIQSSETHSGLCSDPQRELDCLFGKYVL